MNQEFLSKVTEYLGNSQKVAVFNEMVKSINEHIKKENQNVLEIASDKEPVFSSIIAKLFPDSTISHFRDDVVRCKKIKSKYSSIPNLNIAYSMTDLNPPYDMVIAFFTLHELAKPKKSLRKASSVLKENGKIIVVEYDLRWFAKLAKREEWDKEQMKENFSKYVFNLENENKTFREETDCIEHHTRMSLENYLGKAKNEERRTVRRGLNVKDLALKFYDIETPWGKKPKTFLYVGEKI